MRLLLCAAFLPAAIVTVVFAILLPIENKGSTASAQSNLSSLAKTSSHFATSIEFDIPATGSIETPWDTDRLGMTKPQHMI
jgi:hypothetical protein